MAAVHRLCLPGRKFTFG